MATLRRAGETDFYRSVGYQVMCLMDGSALHLPGMETNIALAKRLKD